MVVSAFTLPRMTNLQTKAPEAEPQNWVEKQVRRRLKRELKERLDELKEARSPMKPISVFLGEHQIADLDTFAAEWGISRNELIRLALYEFMTMELELIRDEVEHSAE